MIFLRSNTAVIVAVGPFYDKTDGVTIETALTITNERITLIAETDAGSAPTLILDNITGATAATANDLNYITNGDNGMMQIELAAADVNRVGRMKLSITDAANHVPVFHEFFVLPAAIYDWLTGVIVPLPANVTTWIGTAASTPTVAGVPNVNAKTWNDLTTVALPLVPTTAGRTLDVTAASKVNGVVLVDTLTTYTGNTLQTGDVFPLASTEIADIKAKTDNLPSDPADASVVAGLIAAVEAKVDIVDTVVDVILVDTAEIGAAGAGLTALATQASVTTIDDFLDTEIAAILAAVDTEVAAIKAKTDSLTFTVATVLDANIQRVNDVALIGDGGATPWGP